MLKRAQRQKRLQANATKRKKLAGMIGVSALQPRVECSEAFP